MVETQREYIKPDKKRRNWIYVLDPGWAGGCEVVPRAPQYQRSTTVSTCLDKTQLHMEATQFHPLPPQTQLPLQPLPTPPSMLPPSGAAGQPKKRKKVG